MVCVALAEVAEPFDGAGLAGHELVPQLELRRARQRSTPVVLARDRTLPVVEALAPLLPDGLRRGSAVAVDGGAGATTLALSLAVAASAAGSWTAVVGAPWLGWAQALELGLAPERTLVVDPPRERWATAVAALVDAVDVVLVAGARPNPADVRRLLARARERGAVLVAMPRTEWPGAEVRLTVGSSRWIGPESHGAGRLLARRAEVVASGRGAAGRGRQATLWLPGPDGRVGGS
jgi:hypothetical protein